jgi:hypothetical protein
MAAACCERHRFFHRRLCQCDCCLARQLRWRKLPNSLVETDAVIRRAVSCGVSIRPSPFRCSFAVSVNSRSSSKLRSGGTGAVTILSGSALAAGGCVSICAAQLAQTESPVSCPSARSRWFGGKFRKRRQRPVDLLTAESVRSSRLAGKRADCSS